MGSQMLLLNWNEHKNNVIGEFQQLFSRSELTDVTLACDGYSLEAHKTVLSASSAFFRNLFLHRRCEHAFVILADMDSDSLKAIVDFMYQGQIHISQEKLTQFLKTAEKLKIKGLSTFSQDEIPNLSEEPVTACSRSESGERTELFSKKQPSVRSHVDNSFQPLEQSELSSKRQPAVRRHLDNSFQVLEQTELSPKRQRPLKPHLNSSFQTNEIQQQELSLTSGGTNDIQEPEIDLTSSTYKALKNESCDITPSVHEYCSVDALEPNFSSSIHNLQSNSNEISLNQNVTMPVQSISQETSQWTSQIFPSDDIQFAASSPISIKDESFESNSAITLSGTHKFVNKSNVSKSTLQVSERSLFQCAICEKTFNMRALLLAHQNTHIEEKKLCCGVCNKNFKQKHGLIQHLKVHLGEKPFSCNICNKTFTRKDSVIVHKRIHTGEKPFACKYCNRRFSDRTSLVLHERRHTQEKPFSCHICWRSFYSSSHLKVHVRRHYESGRLLPKQPTLL